LTPALRLRPPAQGGAQYSRRYIPAAREFQRKIILTYETDSPASGEGCPRRGGERNEWLSLLDATELSSVGFSGPPSVTHAQIATTVRPVQLFQNQASPRRCNQRCQCAQGSADERDNFVDDGVVEVGLERRATWGSGIGLTSGWEEADRYGVADDVGRRPQLQPRGKDAPAARRTVRDTHHRPSAEPLCGAQCPLPAAQSAPSRRVALPGGFHLPALVPRPRLLARARRVPRARASLALTLLRLGVLGTRRHAEECASPRGPRGSKCATAAHPPGDCRAPAPAPRPRSRARTRRVPRRDHAPPRRWIARPAASPPSRPSV
jgi:hypothetical protein